MKSRRTFDTETLESRLLLAADVAPLRVNFQPASVPVPPGYVADVGRLFGPRGGGLVYGWNADNTAQVRARRHSAGSPDRAHDTLTHLQKPANPNAVWELALPDGLYAVRLIAGDAEHTDSVYRTDVEGVRVLDAKPTAKARWVEGAAVVRVSDGRLTVTNAAGARNNKLCAIEIAPASSAEPLGVVAPTALAPAPPAGLRVSGASDHSISLHWTDASGDETGFAIDRSADAAFADVRTFTADANATDFTDAGLPDGTTFYYRVRSLGAGGAASANAGPISGTTTLPPPFPLVARPNATGDAMRLTWTDHARNETGFRLERSEAGHAWELVATLPANSGSYVDRQGLLAGANYLYRITAFNAVTASAPSLGRNQPALPSREALLREYWLNVPGSTVGDLTGAPAFAAVPSGAGLLANFESAANFADTYGERLRGYVQAPQTGAYRFFVAGDDAADLYLSNDADPANKRLVASIPAGGATGSRQWAGGPASQQSAPIRLVVGQKYYIELLHKEAGGADHAAVGWQLPDGSMERPIPGWRLSPVRPRVQLYTDESTTIEGAGAAGAVRFTVTRDDDFGRDLVVNYTLGGSANNGSDYSTLNGQVTIPKGAASATFSVVPIDDAISEGKENVTATLTPAPAYTLGPPSQRTGQATIGDNDNLPPGTAAIVPNNPNSFTFYGATRQVISIADPAVPFTQANRVTNTTRPVNVYDIQLQQRNTVALNKNDAMLLTFWARNGNPAAKPSASFQVVFEQAGSPYTHSLTYTGTVDTNWKRFDVPFPVAEAYAVGGAQLGFQLGFDPQTLEIGGVTLTNYAGGIAVADLPRTPQTYQGREATAAWRAAAEDRIEQERKADLSVVVRDAAGNLVDGAAVSVKLLQHDFGFGTAVAGGLLNNTANPDNAKYRQTIKDYFSKVVLENDLKWPGWQANPTTAITAIDWLNANGITDVRGHNLIWPSWRYIPASPGTTYKNISYRADPNKDDSQEEYEAHVTADGLDAAKAWLRQRILDHIAQEAGNASVKGRITDWDVINEPYSEHQIQDILGNLEMVAWFQAAKAADPAARLFLNDYPSLAGGTHLDSFQQTIQYLLDNGAPLEGIGFQSHFGDSLVGMDQIYATYNRFASAFHLPMQVTEFDTTVPDLQLQADFLRDFVTLSFSHPDISSFMMWGFWEGAHWMPSAALWRRDWSIKPNGQAWIDLVKQVWNTQTVGTTLPSGEYRTRGFMGEYDITVTVGGATKTVVAELPKAGTVVQVTVP